jgi:hypothetical protein
MLDRGETGVSCSDNGAARLFLEFLGDAAGDSGAVGPYFESRLGMGRALASVNSG